MIGLLISTALACPVGHSGPAHSRHANAGVRSARKLASFTLPENRGGWVTVKPPFKNLYTCFDERNFAAESAEGVPSGGGWHEIGDAAETIINAVEEAPVLVGQATGLPFPAPDEFAYGLSDVATFHLLKPGEAMITAAGDTTWNEDKPAREGKHNDDGSVNWSLAHRASDTSGAGRTYHWFAFNSNEPTCTEEWVHSCRPTVANPDPACR